MYFIIRKFTKHIDSHRVKQIVLLLILMVVSMFFEVVSLGAVIPFLGVLVAPEQVFSHHVMQPIITLFQIESHDEMVLPIIIIFALVTIFSTFVRLFLLYLLNKVSYMVGHDISVKVFYNALHAPYIDHLLRNSSETVNAIVVKTRSVIYGVLLPTLTIISSTILLMGVVSLMMYINPIFASVGFFLSVSIYLLVMQLMRPRLKKNSDIVAQESTRSLKILREGVGGIRDVIINNNSSFFLNLFKDADLRQRNSEVLNNFITDSPRYIMESLSILLIILLAYVMLLNDSQGESMIVPVLGVIALGAQRLLPVLQSIYQSITSMRAMYASSYDVVMLLESTPEKRRLNSNINFNEKIELVNVGFKYPNTEDWVFKGVNLRINIGDKIGVIGPTGVGKSTFIDILMGLLDPEEGSVLVDGSKINKKNACAWQLNISHVPQQIYIYDTSIEENIALGVNTDNIDKDKVKLAAKMACIESFINNLEDGYAFNVGEGGCRLSGGQRQRLGLARAFYNDSNIMVLDEATSALDETTEKEVISNMNKYNDNTTVFMITHKHATLKYCDIILKFSNSGKIEFIKYSDI